MTAVFVAGGFVTVCGCCWPKARASQAKLTRQQNVFLLTASDSHCHFIKYGFS